MNATMSMTKETASPHTIPDDDREPTKTPSSAREQTMARTKARANIADRIQGVSLMAMAIEIGMFVASGRYQSFVTPRSVPYLVIAAASLAVFAVAAWMGVFRCTSASLMRTLVVVITPTLLMALPMGSANSSTSSGGTNRAIAITDTDHLSGLDAAHRTITISDDEFGAWFDRIDHDPGRYAGYHIIVDAFVSTDSSMGPGQFEASRMLMTCCVLDMTPFGFAVDASATRAPAQNTWVSVKGTVAQGRIGTTAHGYDGVVLKATSITPTTHSPTGYFYRS